MTQIFKHDGGEIRKWRAQATMAGKTLKTQEFPGKDEVKIGFAFDDGVITVKINTATIRELSAEQLGDEIYNAVLAETQTKQPGGSA